LEVDVLTLLKEIIVNQFGTPVFNVPSECRDSIHCGICQDVQIIIIDLIVKISLARYILDIGRINLDRDVDVVCHVFDVGKVCDYNSEGIVSSQSDI